MRYTSRIHERYNAEHDFDRNGPPVPWYTMDLAMELDELEKRLAALEAKPTQGTTPTPTDEQIDVLLDSVVGNTPLRIQVLRDHERRIVRDWLATLNKGE